MTEEMKYTTMPALALRGLTVYPRMIIHFDVGREASMQALEEAMTSNQPIFLVAQKDMRVELPGQKDLFTMGTVSNVRQILRLPGKSIRVMVEGISRGRLVTISQQNPYLLAEVEEIETLTERVTVRGEALVRRAYELFERYGELSPRMSSDALLNVMSSEDPGYIADFIAQNIIMRVADKQAILDEVRSIPRLNKLIRMLHREVEILEMEQEIQTQVQDNLSQSQRDMVLREQLKVIQRELGEGDRGDSETHRYREKVYAAKLPKEVEEKLLKEISHLERQSFGSAEGAVIRNYLDICLELPWSKKTRERINVESARKRAGAFRSGKGERAYFGISGGEATGP
ncbi:MAG: endopeptidase La [Firmicutes bacterium]|nr:endopeptidase La [Bacillota bacterium]